MKLIIGVPQDRTHCACRVTSPVQWTAIQVRLSFQLIGALLSWMLFGISIVQLCARCLPFLSLTDRILTYERVPAADRHETRAHTDIYHVSFPRERFALWASVYTIFALDVFQSIVVACEAWQTLCAGWGRPVNLQFPGWTFTGLPIVSSASTSGAPLRVLRVAADGMCL